MNERKQVCIYCSKKFTKEITVYEFIEQEEWRRSNFGNKKMILLSDLCNECSQEYKEQLKVQ